MCVSWTRHGGGCKTDVMRVHVCKTEREEERMKERESARAREKERESARAREKEREIVCVSILDTSLVGGDKTDMVRVRVCVVDVSGVHEDLDAKIFTRVVCHAYE